MAPRCWPTPPASSNRKPPEAMAVADHLQVPRRHGLFMHHGIDLGDGTVAHYLEGQEILRSPLLEFCRGAQPVVVRSQGTWDPSTDHALMSDDVAKEAYSAIAEDPTVHYVDDGDSQGAKPGVIEDLQAQRINLNPKMPKIPGVHDDKALDEALKALGLEDRPTQADANAPDYPRYYHEGREIVRKPSGGYIPDDPDRASESVNWSEQMETDYNPNYSPDLPTNAYGKELDETLKSLGVGVKAVPPTEDQRRDYGLGDEGNVELIDESEFDMDEIDSALDSMLGNSDKAMLPPANPNPPKRRSRSMDRTPGAREAYGERQNVQRHTEANRNIEMQSRQQGEQKAIRKPQEGERVHVDHGGQKYPAEVVEPLQSSRSMVRIGDQEIAPLDRNLKDESGQSYGEQMKSIRALYAAKGRQ